VVVGVASAAIASGYGPVTQLFGAVGEETWLTAGEFGAVSALLSAQSLTGETLKLGLQDIVGTLVGGSLGYVLYLAANVHTAVTSTDQRLLYFSHTLRPFSSYASQNSVKMYMPFPAAILKHILALTCCILLVPS
jgi:hypothetical protein